jgi:uncharacterized protein
MKNILSIVEQQVKAKFSEENNGHDWFHIQRVVHMALHIQSREGGDRNIVHLGALLHDISDHKLNGGILNQGGIVAQELLSELGLSSDICKRISILVDEISFKGAGVSDQTTSIESNIVQDADRLDAMGAIGIARSFAFGGSRNRSMYHPEKKAEWHDSFVSYSQNESHTINHFYEKLLLLNDRLHTETAKEIGRKRHQYMLDFLELFFIEWNGEYNKP